LLDTEPKIWRRVVVPGYFKLNRLHVVIQFAMGWTNSHLHQFVMDDVYYGDKNMGFEDFLDLQDEKKYALQDLLRKPKDSMVYEYDFGDGWEHLIVVKEVRTAGADFKCVVCEAGEYACPPEDCGGPMGFEAFKEAIADPEHEEHEQMKEWIGGKWDPAKFDLQAVNLALQEVRV
jgi:hypothetical protein